MKRNFIRYISTLVTVFYIFSITGCASSNKESTSDNVTNTVTDEVSEEPQRRKDRILFAGRWSYPDNYQSRNGTYYGVVFI